MLTTNYTMKQFLSSIVLIGLVFSVISCDFLNKSDENLSLEKDFKLVKHENDFSIYVPNYFKESDDLNDEATLQFQNLFKETYLVVIEEPKQDFIDLFRELDEYNDSISPVKNYKYVQGEFFKESVDLKKEYPTESTDINGLPSEIVKFDASIEGIDIAYDVAYIEGEADIYMIMAWTLESRREKYSKTFDMAIKSFREIKR